MSADAVAEWLEAGAALARAASELEKVHPTDPLDAERVKLVTAALRVALRA